MRDFFPSKASYSGKTKTDLLPGPHYEDGSPLPVMEISFRDLACLTFVRYFMLLHEHANTVSMAMALCINTEDILMNNTNPTDFFRFIF